MDPATTNRSREIAKTLIDRYFKTTPYPYTRHHIDSYDQFMTTDIVKIIQSRNPILILKDLIRPEDSTYKVRIELYVGGESGTEITIGTPTISLKQGEEDIRLLFPNEARLRNLTYASTVTANILVKITLTELDRDGKDGLRRTVLDLPPETFQNVPLLKMPIMLQSRFCVLHNKPSEFLKEAGECPEDYGGYFIVDGSEKVLITKQEQAFNTLYITPKDNDPKDPHMKVFSSISCLSEKTRQVKRINIRLRDDDTILVDLPFVRDPVPLFIVFRALGVQTDEDIMRLMFPDFETPEAKLFMPKLHSCILEAYPFLNTWSCVQYIKHLTKGFGEIHVLDILRNQTFVHMPNDSMSQALFLAECVRSLLRVNEGFEKQTDRDDIRNHRCLTSGFLLQMLFNNSYILWTKAIKLDFEREYETNKAAYSGENIRRLFDPMAAIKTFAQNGSLSDKVMKGFKGSWDTGLGEDKEGVLQSLSRLSYTDFMSHCRRIVLEFDTTMKSQGPRRLHTSQYGYFCTSETPGGSSIGISKNMSILTAFSIETPTEDLLTWLYTRGSVYKMADVLDTQRSSYVPVFLNGGLIGMTAKPELLTRVLKVFKRSGVLPYSVSATFSIHNRRLLLYMDSGRPLRPMVWVEGGVFASIAKIKELKTWRDLVLGTGNDRPLSSTLFVDPFQGETLTMEQYIERLTPQQGVLEYIDPYEQNAAFVANFPEQIRPETTHVEVHPSTILSMMTSLIPFSHHNQSPRNQLGDSQSKQAVSLYATNWQNRFDNSAHVLCYGEAPLCRTLYANYLGEGKMPYGQNIVLAIAFWSGYNQDDGIVFNHDAFERGLFRTISYRSYEKAEEDDPKVNTKIRIGNPANPDLMAWKNLNPGLDYSKLDENGIIKVGEFCDETTAIVGAYLTDEAGGIKDHSLAPQVWTRGRVEKVVIVVNNQGLRLVKIRISQDRIPELGDKFSNRHGQKGTIGVMLRGHDMPRSANGIVPDMIMNPHAIPSRMTIAQNLEQLFGKAVAGAGTTADCTAFMNDGSPEGVIGSMLEGLGYEKYGNEILYNGATGEQIPASIFLGPVYGMRLKHMVEDKWQARGKGRKEVMTHQPTGGRGNQGGLKIGEMDRDAIVCHGLASFLTESFMKRSDGEIVPFCTSCGTVPIYNPKLSISLCPMCDGPAEYIGVTEQTTELLPPLKRQTGRIVNVDIPYSTKLVAQELAFGLNIGLRMITTSGTKILRPIEMSETTNEVVRELKDLVFTEIIQPKTLETPPVVTVTVEELEKAAADVGALRRQEARKADEVGIEELGIVENASSQDGYVIPPEAQNEIKAFALVQAQQGEIEDDEEVYIHREDPDAGMPPPLIGIHNDTSPPQGGGAAAAQVVGQPLPAGPFMLSVDTSRGAMEAQGLYHGAPRPLRRARSQGYGQGFGGGGGQAFGGGRGQAFGQAFGGGGGEAGPEQEGSVAVPRPSSHQQQVIVRKLE